MKKSDLIAGLIFLVLGIFILFSSFTFKQTLIMDNYLGAAFFPRIVAVILISLSTILVISSFHNNVHECDNSCSLSKERFFMPLLVIGALILNVFLLNITGFCITSTLMFWFILLITKIRKISYFIIAPVFVGIVYFIFRYLFLVQLPVGIIGF